MKTDKKPTPVKAKPTEEETRIQVKFDRILRSISKAMNHSDRQRAYHQYNRLCERYRKNRE